MAFKITKDDFIGKDIPLTDKLNALYFTLGEACAIANDALDVRDPRIDTLLMAKTWFDLLIETIEDLEVKNPEAYNHIEKNTIIDPTEFDDPNDYEDQWEDEPDAWDGRDWEEDESDKLVGWEAAQWNQTNKIRKEHNND